jgi:hypothetical protein
MLTLEYDEGELDLTKDLSLPFSPFSGLFIESTKDTNLDVRVDDIFWIEDTQSFVVTCYRQTHTTWSHADAIENANREGWK